MAGVGITIVPLALPISFNATLVCFKVWRATLHMIVATFKFNQFRYKFAVDTHLIGSAGADSIAPTMTIRVAGEVLPVVILLLASDW